MARKVKQFRRLQGKPAGCNTSSSEGKLYTTVFTVAFLKLG